MERKTIKNILRKNNIFPSKKLGQNFLIDKKVLRKIIETVGLKSDDVVLEVGPGIGNLTLELARKAKKVIAIEKDPKLVKVLNNELKIRGIKNVKVIQEDILKILSFQFSNFLKKIPDSRFKIPKNFKVVANLPYYIVSPVIRNFLELKNPPQEMVLMVQKEVAQRICVKPPKMNLLAVSVQFYAKPKIISYVSKKSFWPKPKVDSAIIKLIPKNKMKINEVLKNKRELFFKIVKAGFSQPRKQIVNNLSKILKLDKNQVKTWLLKNKISPSQRPETLNLKNWFDLTKDFPFLFPA